MSDISINIIRETGGVTRAGFGTVLILANTAQAYSIYEDLASLTDDFATDTTVYKMAQALMSQDIQPEQFAVAGVTYEAGVDDVTDLSAFLDTLVQDSKDFYFVALEASDEASQEEVSSWAGAYAKSCFVRTDVLPSVSTVTTWGSNTAIYYTTQTDEYPEMAMLGFGAPRLPGSLTWKNAELATITPEALSGTILSELSAARYNVVINSYGRIVTSNGFLQGSLYIDQQRSEDYIDIRLEEDVATLLINSDKVPYDDNGIAQFVSVFENRLNQAFRQGIIAENAGGQALFTVTAVPAADIPQVDFDDRVLRTLSFQYVEAGAIEGLDATGRIVTRDNIELAL